MKKQIIFAAFSFFTVGSTSAASLNTTLPPSLWVASNHDTQAAVGPAVGSSALSQPSWAVLQWYVGRDGRTIQMPPNKYFGYLQNSGGWNNYIHNEFQGQNEKWSLANSAAAVKYNAIDEPWLGGVYTLAQNGQDLPSPCGGESDLFLSPKGPLNSFGSLAAQAPNGFSSSMPLSSMNNLYLHAGVNIVYENIVQKCPDPSENKIGYGVGIFFRNISNNKTFFYQLIIRSSFAQQPANGWYGGFVDAGGNAGVDDYIENLGQPRPVVGGGRVAYSAVDLLPRIKSIISKGWAYNGAGPSTFNFDPNLSNWRIDGTFFGHFMWGGVVAESKWDNFMLQSSP